MTMPAHAAAETQQSPATRDNIEPDFDLDAPPARSLKYSLMLLGMSVVWAVLLGQFGEGDIYWIMGPYAAAMSAVLLMSRSLGRGFAVCPNPTINSV